MKTDSRKSSLSWPVVLILFSISALLSVESFKRFNRFASYPDKHLCDIISSEDYYYFCYKAENYMECQRSTVTFNFTLNEQTLIRTEEIVFRPRISRPTSGKITCYYRPDDLENTIFLDPYKISGQTLYLVQMIVYLLSGIGSSVVGLAVVLTAINSQCSK